MHFFPIWSLSIQCRCVSTTQVHCNSTKHTTTLLQHVAKGLLCKSNSMSLGKPKYCQNIKQYVNSLTAWSKAIQKSILSQAHKNTVYIQSVSGQQNVIKIGHHQQVSSVDSILQRGLLSAADHLSISPTMQFTHHQLHSLSSLESWTTLAGDQSLLLYWTHKFTRAADFND